MEGVRILTQSEVVAIEDKGNGIYLVSEKENNNERN